MIFWDSSAVVPLLIPEEQSTELLQLYKRDSSMLVWWSTSVECASALARVERAGKVQRRVISEAFSRLHGLAQSWVEVQPGDALRQRAQRSLRVHDLRAQDALQLAAVLHASENNPQSINFLCLDARLCLAAEREGLNVLSIAG